MTSFFVLASVRFGRYVVLDAAVRVVTDEIEYMYICKGFVLQVFGALLCHSTLFLPSFDVIPELRVTEHITLLMEYLLQVTRDHIDRRSVQTQRKRHVEPLTVRNTQVNNMVFLSH